MTKNRQFIAPSDVEGLAAKYDLQRYEIETWRARVKQLEVEIDQLKDELEKAKKDLDVQQEIIDMQNAEWWAKKTTTGKKPYG